MKIIKNIMNEKTISLILAIIAYATLSINGVIIAYNPLSWLLLFALIYAYTKVNIYNKEYFKASLIFSVIFSLLLTVGSTTMNAISSDISVFKQLMSIKILITYIGELTSIYVILINLLPKLCSYKISDWITNWTSKKIFITSFLIIFLSWIPYFLALYPGELSPDSIGELGIIINNFTHMTNHHPIIHTLLIAIPYSIGYGLFKSVNVGVAFYSVTQMIIMSIMFSYFITFLFKKKVSRWIIVICICYFAFIPMHAYYSVTMWKDIVFAGLLLVLTVKLIQICDNYDNLKFRNLIPFIIISLLATLFRNNAIYMYFILMIVTLIILKKKFKILLLSFLIVIASYYTITIPVFNLLNIERSSSSEYIGMPLQQIGRMAYKKVKFNKQEKKMLNNLMGIENIRKYYIAECADGIKFNENYNRDYFDNNKVKFLKLWMGLVVKHPAVATEAYFISTLGYWYPGVNNWTVIKGVELNNYGVTRDSKLPTSFVNIIYKIESRGMPLINMTWSTALAFWISAVFAYVCIKKRKKKYMIAYIPIFGILVTMLIAAPTYAEFRYIYSAYTCLPLLMVLPYIKIKKENK